MACVKMGYQLFDCVIPTREARHQRLYVFQPGATLEEKFYKHLYIMDDKYCRDGGPIRGRLRLRSVQKSFPGVSAAPVPHERPAAMRLATAHNLRFFGRLMERLRGK